MMRIFRENVGEESWEIPRGFTENEENGFMTAQREMMEEISCESEKIINLGYIFTDTGLMDSKINLYLGINTEIKEDRLQKEEGINTIKFIDYDSVYNMALKGEINDSYTLAAILRSKPYI